MDYYHMWFNLKPGVDDVEFTKALSAYLNPLREEGRIGNFHLSRRKLGFGPSALGEFHAVVETQNMAQLDEAFRTVATRAGVVESLHAAVNQSVTDFTAALYRDFPDPERVHGEEKF